jgi:two-component system, OmpR family, sensor kinase
VAEARSRPIAPRGLRSVRVRLTLAAVVATAVAVTAAGWLLVRSVEDTQTARVRHAAEDMLDQVVAELGDGTAPLEAVRAATSGSAAETDVLAGVPAFIQIVDEDGRTLSVGPVLPAGAGSNMGVRIEGSDLTVVGQGVSPPPDAQVGSGATDTTAAPSTPPPSGDAQSPFTTQVDPSEEEALARRTTLVAANNVFSFEPQRLSRTVDTPSGELTVYAAAPVDEVQENLEAVRQALWVGGPLLVAAVAAVGWYLVGRALRPVEAIRAEVAAIGGATIHRRVPTPETDDEIGRLAHTMNAMLDRLEAASTRQRQFVSDASHELRSPVTAIRTDVEVALREGERADWEAVGSAVLAEEERLERLLDDLLTLAAADEDSGAARRADERVDVRDLVADVAARPRRVPVRWDGVDGAAATGRGATPTEPADADPLVVAGRPDALARLLTNLVDNAARHAATAVDVYVDVAASPTGTPVVHLAVDDDGRGVPAADRQRIFDRFTRLDDGRARDRGGAGLGLAVVRSIAVGHRGRVWVGDSPSGGARFVVELPAAPAAAGSGSGARG